jgi:hypothetical protein
MQEPMVKISRRNNCDRDKESRNGKVSSADRAA